MLTRLIAPILWRHFAIDTCSMLDQANLYHMSLRFCDRVWSELVYRGLAVFVPSRGSRVGFCVGGLVDCHFLRLWASVLDYYDDLSLVSLGLLLCMMICVFGFTVADLSLILAASFALYFLLWLLILPELSCRLFFPSICRILVVVLYLPVWGLSFVFVVRLDFLHFLLCCWFYVYSFS